MLATRKQYQVEFGAGKLEELKILQIIGSSGSGGAEKFYLKFIESIRSVCKIVPLVRSGSWVASQLDAARIPYNTASFGGYFDCKTRIKISQIIEEEQPHIAQTWMSRASRHMPKDSNVKWIGRLGGYYDLKYYKGADMLVGNTKDICAYLVRNGWPEEQVSYLPNFAIKSPEIFKADRVKNRQKMGIPEDAILLFSAGRFHKNKGYDLAVKAIAKLPQEFHLLVAGEGPEKKSLLSDIKRLSLQSRVHIYGWADDITPYVQVADIWLVPSRIEPLGNVILESWASGIPIVASDAVGPRFLIENGSTGLLFRNGDCVDLATEVKKLSTDPVLMNMLIQNGKKRFSEDFSRERVLEKWVKFYKNLL
ncbi:MAG: hypothetical protein CMM44_00705 [Rhodospirillaceae bacterium]|nr:hypothetical protein [Rhodospirillaceae bacterium]